jgi:hypothetical protein
MLLNRNSALQTRKSYGWWLVILLAAGVAGCSNAAPAPPAKVTFENSLFRVFDVQVPAGTKFAQSFQNDLATVAMLDGTRISTTAAGKESGENSPLAGAVMLGAAGEHGVQNLGESPFQLLAVEKLRNHGQAQSEPLSGGMTMSAESPAFRAYEVKLSNSNTQVGHTHTVPAVVVLIEGKVLSQGPENKDPELNKAPTGLKQLDQRGQWLYVPPGGSHYVVRLGTDSAHVVELELR